MLVDFILYEPGVFPGCHEHPNAGALVVLTHEFDDGERHIWHDPVCPECGGSLPGRAIDVIGAGLRAR